VPRFFLEPALSLVSFFVRESGVREGGVREGGERESSVRGQCERELYENECCGDDRQHLLLLNRIVFL